MNYTEQLQKFHAQQGNKRISIPVIERKTVDLYSLKLIVARYGGYEESTKNRKWTDVTRNLGYADSVCNQLSPQVKAAYKKIILPFEEFLVDAKEEARRSESAGDDSGSTSPPFTKDGSVIVIDDDDDEATAAAKRRKSRRKAEGSKESSAVSSRRPKKHGEGKSSDVQTLPGAEGLQCEICMSGEEGTSMLLCDGCNRGYHMYCLNPPLATVPKSEWFCPPCLVGTGNDYGFEDGETHSLHTFYKRSEEFRKAWWKARPDHIFKPERKKKSPLFDPDGDAYIRSESPEMAGLPNGVARTLPGTDSKLSEDDVEREFWRLIFSPDEHVDVEYGADVHSTTHGR